MQGRKMNIAREEWVEVARGCTDTHTEFVCRCVGEDRLLASTPTALKLRFESKQVNQHVE